MDLIIEPYNNSIKISNSANMYYATNAEAKIKNRNGKDISDKVYIKFAIDKLNDLGSNIILIVNPKLAGKIMEPSNKFVIDYIVGFE